MHDLICCIVCLALIVSPLIAFMIVAYQNAKLLNECEKLIQENKATLNEMKEIQKNG